MFLCQSDSLTQSCCFKVAFLRGFFFFFLSYSPEDKIKAMEKKVNELIEESCFAASRGEYQVVC